MIRCPWHGWELDLGSGEALFTEDKRHLRTFDARVEDGAVVVELGRERRREGAAALPAAGSAGEAG